MPEFPRNNAVQRARHLLIERASSSGTNARRKYSLENAEDHSIRVAEKTKKAISIVTNNPKVIDRAVVKALGHDWIEDFGVTAKEITQLFGKEITRGITLMTIPPYQVLADSFYPDITQRYLGNATDIRDLEKKRQQDFVRLKSSLKTHFKVDVAERFSLDEIVVKTIDSADALSEFATHIKDGTMYVVDSPRLGTPQKWQGQSVPLTTGEIAHNTRGRSIVHKATMERLDVLAETLKPNNADGIDIKKMAKLRKHLDETFHNAFKELDEAATASLLTTKGPARPTTKGTSHAIKANP